MKGESREKVGVWGLWVGVKRKDCTDRYPLGIANERDS